MSKFLLKVLSGAVIAISIGVNYSHASLAGDTSPSMLQQAVNLIDSNPAKAEQMFKLSDKPTAYAYLAYMYFTNKVPVQNRAGTVDALMNKAIHSKLIDDTSAFGEEIDPQTKYHYDSLATLLKHLRMISDASYSTAPAAPVSIFKAHPREAFAAFDSLWGSRRDSYLETTWNRNSGIAKLPSVVKLIEIDSAILGDPPSSCTGTIIYAHLRRIALSDMKASLAPRIFLAGKSQEESEGGCDPDLGKFLTRWSNVELWNKVQWRNWNQLLPSAERELADYYVKEFGLSAADATKAANVALWHITSVYLSIFSSETLKEQVSSPIYQCFTRDQLTLEQMNVSLAGKTLDADEATAALSYSILNNAKMEVIEALIKNGAVLNPKPQEEPVGAFEGGESPLFSSVLRPDVVSVLIKAGADVNYQNMVGKTALIQAIQYDALDTVKVLLAAGAKINEGMAPADGEGAGKANDTCFYNYTIGKRTPLMYACAFASAPLINHLLDSGAEKKARDSKGGTAESYLKDNKLLSDADRKALSARLK